MRLLDASSRHRRSRPVRSSPFALLACAALFWASGCVSTQPAPVARDGFPLDPREGLVGPFDASIEKGWRALESGDPERARDEFRRASSGTSERAGAIGSIEVLVLTGRAEDAAPLCALELAEAPATLPLWTACGEASAQSGDLAAAFELYERAAERAPQRAVLARRAEELRGQATDALLAAAEREASEGQRAPARAKVAQALDWNPGTASVLVRAAEVECAAGEKEAALLYYRDAIALAGLGGLEDSAALQAGDLAVETGDLAMAVTVFDSLAARNPTLRERAAEARLAFRVDNWPDAERQAARARRSTRAGAALLSSWMFPELREVGVRSGVVAGDVLERKDSRLMIRAVALGLLDVDPETHRARPDAPLSRAAAAQLLLRLPVVLGKTAGVAGCQPPGGDTMRTGAEAIRLAARCGLLSESGGPYVSGPELTRGLDRLRSTFTLGEATRRD